MTLSERALARRAKKYLRDTSLELYLSVLPGLEEAALADVRNLAAGPRVERGGISFHGHLDTIYEANLSSRTGGRVLVRIGQFLAQSYPMLYHHTKRIPWEVLLGNCLDAKIRVTFARSRLRNKDHIRTVLQQAIAERLEHVGVERCDTEPRPQIGVFVRLTRDRCIVSLDTTGAHLHKRGYRQRAGPAPLRETTAAGILNLARAGDYDVLVDPFCGSGTFCIEADQAARNVPPGYRRSFAIEATPLHSEGVLAHVRRRLASAMILEPGLRVLGVDSDPAIIDVARANAADAGAHAIMFERGDATSTDFANLKSQEERGLIVGNLPYGRRLGTASSAEALARAFSRRLLERARGWDFALVSVAPDAFASPALQITRKVHIQNGGVRVAVLFGRVLRP